MGLGRVVLAASGRSSSSRWVRVCGIILQIAINGVVKNAVLERTLTGPASSPGASSAHAGLSQLGDQDCAVRRCRLIQPSIRWREANAYRALCELLLRVLRRPASPVN